MIQTTQNLDLFNKKTLDITLPIFDIVNAILKEVLHVKQIMMLRVFSVKLPSFIIPKITVV